MQFTDSTVCSAVLVKAHAATDQKVCFTVSTGCSSKCSSQIGQLESTGQANRMKLMHVQVQRQLEAQQAQHAAQIEDMSSKAAQMESLIRQATELDQQHVTEVNAREADLDELRQVNRVYVQDPICLT